MESAHEMGPAILWTCGTLSREKALEFLSRVGLGSSKLVWKDAVLTESNPNRYVIVSMDYPPNKGGVSRLCAQIVNGLSSMGEVSVITRDFEDEGTYIPAGPSIHEYRYSGRGPAGRLASLYRLKSFHPSIPVIASTWYPEGMLAKMAGSRNIVILAHGAELGPQANKWKRLYFPFLQRWILGSAEVVMANSQYTAQLVQSLAPNSNVVDIPLGVDHLRFQPGDRLVARRNLGIAEGGRKVLLSVARLEPHKGIDTVLEAIARLPVSEREDLLYLVAGSGSQEETLKTRASLLGIDQSVRWLGFVKDGDLPGLYQAADLFVLCSREALQKRQVEGFGLVFLEAQACGVPVVGTRSGGIPDAIVEGHGGWLIEEDDVDALASIIGELNARPESFASAGAMARARVESEATLDAYIANVVYTIQRRGRRGRAVGPDGISSSE